MIRKTLARTKAATLQIMLPTSNPAYGGNSVPTGTGFLVSPDGWVVTAAHVVAEPGTNTPRSDLGRIKMVNKAKGAQDSVYVSGSESSSLECFLPELDFALFKVRPAGGADEQPFIEITDRPIEEGEPVYTYGFPLPEYWETSYGTGNIQLQLDSRVTSAIVAGISKYCYVIDKALNPGNSGGPVVITETGKVAATFVNFGTFRLKQFEDTILIGGPETVRVPSLYSYAVSLGAKPIWDELFKRGIIRFSV